MRTTEFQASLQRLRVDALAQRQVIDNLLTAIDAVAGLPALGTSVTTNRGSKNGHLKGTDLLVYDAIKEERADIKRIVALVRVQENAVRKSIRRLTEMKKIREVAKTWPRQYEAANAKRATVVGSEEDSAQEHAS